MLTIPDGYVSLLEAFSVDVKGMLRSEVSDDARLVQKGLMLYRQGLVSKLRFEDEAVLATVQDVIPVQVRLDLNFPDLSECSCPYEEFCRHRLAAFFQAFSQIGSVADWVEEWRQPIKEKQTAQKWGLERAKDLLKTTGQLNPDYERWIKSFDESFDALMKGQKNLKPYLVPDLFSVYKRRLQAGAPLQQEWKQLYLLVASIHAFRKLLELSQELGHDMDEINRYYRQLFYNLMDDIEDIVERLSIHALPFAFDEFMEKLKEESTLLLTAELELNFERTHLYRILWTQLFKKKTWREQEQDKLAALIESGTREIPIKIGLIHQYFLLSKDQDAVKMIKTFHTDITPYMLYWLEVLTAQKDWKRISVYVDEFTSMVKPYMSQLNDTYACMDFTRFAIRVVGEYFVANQELDRYERLLAQTLPFSHRHYDELLFDQGLYHKWAELQTYLGFGINSIPTAHIKLVQKEDPSVLLPLYHQSVQRHINLKNRGNYREAVRELKKLRTIYKKLKRVDDWEQFIELLLEKTKRLRAFQEECKRGKLTHA